MQPKQNIKIIAESYQAKKGHGIFKKAYYFNEIEYNKKPNNRKDWFYESIIRFSKNSQVKCISYNHHVQSAWLYENYIPSSIVDKNNNKLDYKLKNNKFTQRYKWHTFVIFD